MDRGAWGSVVHGAAKELDTSEQLIQHFPFSREQVGTSPVVQWLRIQTSEAEVAGSIPGQGTKILRAVQPNNKLID